MKPESRDEPRRYETRPLLKTAAAAVVLGAVTWLLAPLLFPVRLPEGFPKPPDLRAANPGMRAALRSADEEARRRPGSAEAVGELGMAYHANLFLDQAAAAYRIAARLAPGDYRWAYCQAFLAEENGDEQDQQRFLQETLRLKPDHVPALLRLADAEFKRDRLDEAAQHFQQAAGAADSHSSLQAAFGMGRVAARRRQWNQVIAYVDPLTRSYPYLQPPYELLQEAYDALGQHEKAVEARQNIALSKSKVVPPPQDALNDQLIAHSYNSTRLLKQAGLLSRFGFVDQSLQVGRRAAEVDSKDPDVRNFLARTLLTAYPNKPEAVDEALTQMSECLRLRPDDPVALWGFANVFFESPKTPAAVERLGAMLKPFASRGDAHFFLGMVADAQGQGREAIAQYEAALQDNPNNASAYVKLGTVRNQEGQFDQAITHFRHAIQLEPANTTARFNLGVTLLQRGRDSEGLKELNEVLRLKPHDPATHFCIGFASLYAKRLEEAIAHFQEGLRYNPDDPEAHYGLGSAFATQRRLQDAVAALREAIRLRPNNPEAQALLQQLER